MNYEKDRAMSEIWELLRTWGRWRFSHWSTASHVSSSTVWSLVASACGVNLPKFAPTTFHHCIHDHPSMLSGFLLQESIASAHFIFCQCRSRAGHWDAQGITVTRRQSIIHNTQNEPCFQTISYRG
jgi:hypothetical protein